MPARAAPMTVAAIWSASICFPGEEGKGRTNEDEAEERKQNILRHFISAAIDRYHDSSRELCWAWKPLRTASKYKSLQATPEVTS